MNAFGRMIATAVAAAGLSLAFSTPAKADKVASWARCAVYYWVLSNGQVVGGFSTDIYGNATAHWGSHIATSPPYLTSTPVLVAMDYNCGRSPADDWQ